VPEPKSRSGTIVDLRLMIVDLKTKINSYKSYGLEAEPEAQNPIFQRSNIPTFQL